MAENEHDVQKNVRVEGAHTARKAEASRDEEPVDYLKILNKGIVDSAREALKEEAKHLEHTNGPADTVTGSTASSKEDLLGQTPDPYARAIPPGPDDPYAEEQ